MTHRFETTLLISVAGGEEREIAILVQYSREKGAMPTLIDPGADAAVTVDRILVRTPEGTAPAGWLEDVLREDAELLGDLMRHWTDEDEAARDRRDEDREQARRDDARE